MENQTRHTVSVNLFNQTAQFSRARLPKTQRDPKYHWYEIRHSDCDLGKPSTIEERVVVNHYGTIGFPKELVFKDDSDRYISLDEEQICELTDAGW